MKLELKIIYQMSANYFTLLLLLIICLNTSKACTCVTEVFDVVIDKSSEIFLGRIVEAELYETDSKQSRTIWKVTF